MLSQTVDQMFPLLQMLQQPAFCIKQDGTVLCNREAQTIAPASGASLLFWLGESAPLYEQWDRQGTVTLPVSLAGQSVSVIIQPLSDGALFLLSQCQSLTAGTDTLSVTAQVLRQPLTDLFTLIQSLTEELEEMEDPLLQSQSAAINRQIYRLSRIACNLADLEQLRCGTYQPRLENLSLTDYLLELNEELKDVCRSAGRTIICRLPAKPIVITADPLLLERAVLNLLSNAIKYGKKSDPIEFQVDTTASSVLLRMRNTCAEANSDLLAAAFQRINKRGVLPDPQWGLGIGLPMVQNIAHLLGGTVAVAMDQDQVVTVTMSIGRKKLTAEVNTPIRPPIDYAGGMRHSLVELSDVLPDECFDSTSI